VAQGIKAYYVRGAIHKSVVECYSIQLLSKGKEGLRELVGAMAKSGLIEDAPEHAAIGLPSPIIAPIYNLSDTNAESTEPPQLLKRIVQPLECSQAFS
jgi:hypothetical protein